MSKRGRGYMLLVVVVVALGWYVWHHRFGIPEDFTDPSAELKYGSIGSDHPLAMAPLPYWIFKVLPDLFAPSEVIPEGYGPRNGKQGYAAFGLVTEPSMPLADGGKPGQMVFKRPIGVSKRTVLGVDLVGFNCSVCHLTTMRTSPDASAEIVLGGTGNTINIEQLFLYMFGAIKDPRFNADNVMAAVNKAAASEKTELGLFQRLLYRYVAIPLIPKLLQARQDAYFDFITIGSPNRLAPFGPGRVDTWAVYKRLYANPAQRTKTDAIVDFPPIWNGRARPAGMQMHWDGNTDVFEERNVISALAVIGRNVEYLDFPRVTRIAEISSGMLPPRYEDRVPLGSTAGEAPIAADLAARGAILFKANCAVCHASDGIRLGRVEPIANLATDSERLEDFTNELAISINQLGTDEWKLRKFKPQKGYVNNLLDGIWLRGPYLHNGSVPTLRDLLDKPESRPKIFCRGSDVIDWQNVGFATKVVEFDDRALCDDLFLYDTTVKGNSNAGHTFGTKLDVDDKRALLEFMKTL